MTHPNHIRYFLHDKHVIFPSSLCFLPGEIKKFRVVRDLFWSMKMKIKLIPSAVILAGFSAFSLSSLAADANASSTSDESAKTAPAPHSHTQEKGYGPASKTHAGDKAKKDEASSAAAVPNPANDRSKHFHPRDR